MLAYIIFEVCLSFWVVRTRAYTKCCLISPEEEEHADTEHHNQGYGVPKKVPFVSIKPTGVDI